jgi:mannose-6-phosphate isomerase-like protein (cupin superfamily)
LIRSIENAEHYEWGAGCDGWLLVKTNDLSVIQERVPPGGSEIRHLHRRSEQFFYVISGLVTIEIDGEVFEITEQQGIHVPAGVPHQLKNISEVDAVFIVTSTPSSHGDRVEI